MTIEELRKVHQASPFRPFTIYLADQRSFFIPHRDFLSHSPGTGRTVIVYDNNGSFDILDLLLVTDIKLHAPAPAEGAST
jgi:hypothetical protein